MIKTSDEGTSYCTQCEIWARELAAKKAELAKVKEFLRQEHENFIARIYRDPKTHSRKDCRFCGALAAEKEKKS